MNFDQFEQGWLSLPLPQRLVDFDGVFRYQCVDLILDGEQKMNGLGRGSLWGNAIDYWNNPAPALRRVRDPIATDNPEKGDIVVCKTHGYYGDPAQDPGDGHIVYATGNVNATQFEALEQNGYDGSGRADLTDGDKIRTRWIDRNRIAGVWREKSNKTIPVGASPTGTSVHLPETISSWAVYKIGSGLRKGTPDQVGTLDPAQFGGLTYPILGWVGDYAVNIHTETYGDVSIWVKGTVAQFITPPPAPALPYTITEFSAAKQYKVTPGHEKWNLALSNFEAVANAPAGTSDDNTIITARASLRHNDPTLSQYVYYLGDPNTPQSWNSLDCTDYTPPPPKVPDAPLPFPAAEKFDLKVTVAGFKTAEDAHNDTAAETTVSPGPQYYVFERDEKTGMVNITTSAAKEGYWINPADNEETKIEVKVDPPKEAVPEIPTESVPEPEKPAAPTISDVTPAPQPKVVDESWKKTFSFFNTDRTPILFLTTNQRPYDVFDLGSSTLLGKLYPSTQLHIIGTFEKDGVLYGLTYEGWLQGGYPNVPMRFLKLDRFGNFLHSVGQFKQRIEGIFK